MHRNRNINMQYNIYLHGGRGSSEDKDTFDVWHTGNGHKGLGRCVGVGGHSI